MPLPFVVLFVGPFEAVPAVAAAAEEEDNEEEEEEERFIRFALVNSL